MDTIKINKDINGGQEPTIDYQRLRKQWFVKYSDILSGVPPELPPLYKINHRIPLIDKDKRYTHCLPQCPEAMQPQLLEKLQAYSDASWWMPKAVPQATPLLCIPKKTGKLRTVVNCHQQNNNMMKDVTPFLDQDKIRMNITQAKFRSKINLSNAYEQICIEPSDVHKTAFVTIFGTFKSNVMQQGNCNAPTTFLRLMTAIFRDVIGVFVYAYLDDLFVFSNMLEDHEKHLEYIFQTLQKNHLFLEKEKCDLYSTSMECLGHLVDD